MPPYAEGTVSERRRADIVDSPQDAEDLGELVRRVDFPGLLINLDVTLEEVDGVIADVEMDTALATLRDLEKPFKDQMRALAKTVASEKAGRAQQPQRQVSELAPQPWAFDGTYATASDAEKNYLDKLQEWEREKVAQPHSYVPKPHRADEPFRLYSAV